MPLLYGNSFYYPRMDWNILAISQITEPAQVILSKRLSKIAIQCYVKKDGQTKAFDLTISKKYKQEK